MKRAHWNLTWWAIREFRKKSDKWKEPALREMTPARYDIIYAMTQRPRWWQRPACRDVFQMPFRDLVEKLGLHPSTISKCLTRLIALKFMTRHQAKHDARVAIFRLTELGLAAFKLANRVLWGGSPIEAFWKVNARFAGGAAWDQSRMEWCLREPIDSMLVGFGNRLRECATYLGSLAWPIYDSDFEDPCFVQYVDAP